MIISTLGWKCGVSSFGCIVGYFIRSNTKSNRSQGVRVFLDTNYLVMFEVEVVGYVGA